MRDPTCVNLQQEFGDRYRVTRDPASTPRGATDDPWNQRIPTRSGEIYPFGAELLVVEVEGHRKPRGQLSRLECCKPHQTGDEFGSFRFDAKHFDQIAEIVKPRKRWQVSEEERQRLAEMSAKYGFKGGSDGRQPHQSGAVDGAPTHFGIPA
jgi:hypothetical protein